MAAGGRQSPQGRARPEQGFEPVDHTADAALRIWAPDLEGLFRQAARGLLALLTDPQRITARERHDVQVEGLDLEELLVAYLGELLYRFETERLLLAECPRLRISRGGAGYRLAAQMRGERHDPERHPAGAGIKAPTYHGLQIAPREDGPYEVTIVFDT